NLLRGQDTTAQAIREVILDHILKHYPQPAGTRPRFSRLVEDEQEGQPQKPADRERLRREAHLHSRVGEAITLHRAQRKGVKNRCSMVRSVYWAGRQEGAPR